MKNMKKISLVSFLACASLAGGIMMANTEAPEVAEPYFKMEVGAQVRVPDEVEGELVKDGLRFTAKMSDSFWQANGGLEGKSVGMFIMPAAYASKPINYDNCFGESACYYWNGVEAKTENAKEILHVDSYAYEEYAGAPELTMKASIWNMNVENLDKEFVAVAYMTDGTNYWFAETAQGAKTVSVAQKALLNPEDEIYSVDGAAAKVETAYVNAYLGEDGKEVTYTETVYKQQKDGSYTLVEEDVEKVITVKSYNTQATKDEEFAKYEVNKSASTDRTILFEGSLDIDTYYNYTGNRVVIWDGDEYTADSTYGLTNYRTNEPRPNGWTCWQDSGSVDYEGESALMFPSTDGWDGPLWTTPYVLPMATNTISMMVYSEYENELIAYVHGTTEAGAKKELEATFDIAYTIPGEWVKVTMTFAQAFVSINCFEFRQFVTDEAFIYYDNICAENIQTVKGVNVDNIYTDSISFTVDVADTSCWDGETSDFAPAAQFKSNLSEDYSDITAVDGVYTITPDADAYKYEILVDGKTYTTVKGVSLVNFDTPAEDRDYIAAITGTKYGHAYTSDKAEGGNPSLKLVDIDGKTMITAAGNGWWVYAHVKDTARDNHVELVAGFTPTKVGFFVYSTDAKTTEIYTYGANSNSQYNAEGEMSVGVGYQYFEVTFAKDLAGTYAIGLSFGPAMSFYLYEIVLIA